MLTNFGIGVPTASGGIAARKKRFKSEQIRLLNNEERFESACTWLQGLEKSQEVNRRHTSYFMKHIAERRIGGHLSNGAFIAAALHCGFKFEHSSHYPNLFFNIDEDSLQAAHKESLNFEKYSKEHIVMT